MVVKEDNQFMRNESSLQYIAWRCDNTSWGCTRPRCKHTMVLEVFWDICASKRQAIAVAQYIGTYEGGFDPQYGHNKTWCEMC